MKPYDPQRYSRQTRFAPLGTDGQTRLAAARVVVMGCGALGSVVAMALVRAGVGSLRIIDRDLPELSNLPRQVLFCEADIAAGFPKSVAAKQHLERINSAAKIEAVVADLTASNAEELLAECDVIVDGTDNFEARFLVNDFSCQQGVPWIYGGAIGAEGRVMTVLPGQTACLRCLIVGAFQSAEAIKVLLGASNRFGNRLWVCDLWEGVWRTIDLTVLATSGCPTCRDHDFPWLSGRAAAQATVICGREAVQVTPQDLAEIDLVGLASRLASVGQVMANPWLVRVEVEPGIQLSVFGDGRAIVAGTREEAKARAVVARYVGT